MTQTTLSRGLRQRLEALTFDGERVGPYAVAGITDAYTSESTPERQYVARHFVTLLVDVDGRTVELLGCSLCNRVAVTVAVMEGHIRTDHANGDRRARAGDVRAAEQAEQGDQGDSVSTEEVGTVPQQREAAEPEQEPATPVKRRATSSAAMERKKATRRAYDLLVKEHGEMSLSEAARRLDMNRDTLRGHLNATERTTRAHYDTRTPEETAAAYRDLIAREGPKTIKEAAAALNVSRGTLSKRLKAAEEAEASAAPPEEAAAEGVTVPALALVTYEAPPDVDDEQDDEQDDDEPDVIGEIDEGEEERLELMLSQVAQMTAWGEQMGRVAASRNEWRARALNAEQDLETVTAERDDLAQRLEVIEGALRRG